jgi:hypothetical protein
LPVAFALTIPMAWDALSWDHWLPGSILLSRFVLTCHLPREDLPDPQFKIKWSPTSTHSPTSCALVFFWAIITARVLYLFMNFLSFLLEWKLYKVNHLLVFSISVFPKPGTELGTQ